MYFEIYFDRDDIVAGAIGFIATAGEMLNFHPHIHVLITDGGFLKDGTFRHMLYWDTDKLEELFRAEVFRLLLEKELIGRDTVVSVRSDHVAESRKAREPWCIPPEERSTKEARDGDRQKRGDIEIIGKAALVGVGCAGGGVGMAT